MKNNSIGSSWEEARKDLFNEEEINASNMRVAVINEFISALKLLASVGKTLAVVPMERELQMT